MDLIFEGQSLIPNQKKWYSIFMETFHVGCKIENHIYRDRSVRIAKALVDTGSEYTWVPSKKLEQIGVKREKKDIRFIMANGEIITRSVGFAILRVAKTFTT